MTVVLGHINRRVLVLYAQLIKVSLEFPLKRTSVADANGADTELFSVAVVSTEDHVFMNWLTLEGLKSSTIIITYRLLQAPSDSIGLAKLTYSKAARSEARLSVVLCTAH